MEKYKFEEITYNRAEVSEEDLDVLDTRLGLKRSNTLQESNIKSKVHTFINIHHGNISWYIKEIKTEEGWKWFYMGLTLILVVLLPVGVFYFTDFMWDRATNSGEGKTVEYYSSFVLAVLTSIFAFHKVLNIWLGKRKLLSVFGQASADLKANLYAFEDRWNNRDDIYDPLVPGKVSQEFDDDLEITNTKGREIANIERKKYYEFIENPEVNLDTIFTGAFQSATALFTNLRSIRFANKLTDLEQERKKSIAREELQKEITSLEKEVLELELELVKLKAEHKNAKGDEKTRLKVSIDSYTKYIVQRNNLLKTKYSKR